MSECTNESVTNKLTGKAVGSVPGNMLVITAVYHRAKRIRPVGYRCGSGAGGRAEGEGESNERSERQFPER